MVLVEHDTWLVTARSGDDARHAFVISLLTWLQSTSFSDHHDGSRLHRLYASNIEIFGAVGIGQSNVPSYFHVTLEEPCESASFTNNANSRRAPALDAVTFVTYPENTPQHCLPSACHTISIRAYPIYTRTRLGNTLNPYVRFAYTSP